MTAEHSAFAGDLRGALTAVRGRRDDEAMWVRAYVAAARGSFTEAERRARALTRSPRCAVRAALTLGSVLRQTERHAEAREVDVAALRLAGTADERAHVLISLAADAVGLGLRTACAESLAAATACARGWRAKVRLSWVRAEHALLTGDPATAAGHAGDALMRSRRAGAARHEAKSLLFLGVSLREAGLPGDAEALSGARRLAHEIGARSISSVCDALQEARPEPAGGR